MNLREIVFCSYVSNGENMVLRILCWQIVLQGAGLLGREENAVKKLIIDVNELYHLV